jgi:AraC-like DNA-binding protein
MKLADVSSLRMLRRARDRIDRDYADPIYIPALAAGAGYSREHFIRAFRAAYGETPGATGPGGGSSRLRTAPLGQPGRNRDQGLTIEGMTDLWPELSKRRETPVSPFRSRPGARPPGCVIVDGRTMDGSGGG